MRWLINYIRSCFCKHEWELIFNNYFYSQSIVTGKMDECPYRTEKVYRCKKCGIEKRYSSS